MKANLPNLEPSILAKWATENVYAEILAARKDHPTFILHDGPPYTNNPVHLGTALNKILKDFVLKSRSMMGFRAPYIPGFDNHGLPIEQAVTKKFAERKETITGAALRMAAREHAQEFINVQSEQFQRLGVFGRWDAPYATMKYRYEAELVRTFGRLVDLGLVYKGLRPTLWSPTCQTALADTEIVYKDVTSKSIFVRFKLRHDPNRLFERFENFYTVIWTTTPWTIPSNLAVAFHPQLEYSVVRVGSLHYLVVSALVTRLSEKLQWEHFEVVETLDGINLDHAEFSHPIFDRPSLAVMAEYVTTEDGTGVVHTAPSHGRDDFFTGQKYGLPVPNTVDERGFLTAETGEFEGTYYKNCDTVVVERLAEVGALLLVEDYHHSYPHAERDDKPVIFRATEQWFISIDPIRGRMLEEVERVQWVPAVGKNRIQSMVQNRPDWCVSRQRPWGVGLPIFYGLESGEPLLDPVAIEYVARAVEKHGSGAWFEMAPGEILPAGYQHPVTGETEFRKETDTLDVWFDSGASSLVVLEAKEDPRWESEGLRWPADVYFEGSDQHRGWFNTSLILGTAIHGRAPYDIVVTHGFVADSEGRKMSKRLGNVIEPVEACNTFGADVVRYWAASVNYQDDVPCSKEILTQMGDSYRNVRNTLRFLLSNAAGFDVARGSDLNPEFDGEAWQRLDRWIRQQTDLLVDDVVSAYTRFDFDAVMTAIHNFCREELSRFYLDVIKDRMYCDGLEWPSRIAGQSTCLYVVERLVKLIAPVLVFTAEETWMKMQSLGLAGLGSVHACGFPIVSPERLQEIEGSELQAQFSMLRGIREDVNIAFESYKGTDGIKNRQDAFLRIQCRQEAFDVLNTFGIADLANLLQVSWVELSVGDASIAFSPSQFNECARSRLKRPDVEHATWSGESILLSARDRMVLGV
jgi:isoleucyl-tRNA synthetase